MVATNVNQEAAQLAGRILVVDDEQVVHRTIRRNLRGFEITDAYSGEEALTLLGEPFDLVISDIRMPGMSGIELLQEIRKRNIPVEFIILTGYAALDTASESARLGARGYFEKPLDDIDKFRRKVQDAVNAARAPRQQPSEE